MTSSSLPLARVLCGISLLASLTLPPAPLILAAGEQPDPPVPAQPLPAVETGVEWISVAGKDPGEVDAAIAALDKALHADDAKTAFLAFRARDLVGICGTPHDRAVASSTLLALPAATTKPAEVRAYQLKPGANPELVTFLFKRAGLSGPGGKGDLVIASGPSAALDQFQADLAAGGLLLRTGLAATQAPVCETVRLSYVRGLGTDIDKLKDLLKTLAPDVKVAGGPTSAGLGSLVLVGPPGQVDDVKRLVASLDVPCPQVRLELWAVQLSGANARQVADRAQQAADLVAAFGHLIRTYGQALQLPIPAGRPKTSTSTDTDARTVAGYTAPPPPAPRPLGLSETFLNAFDPATQSPLSTGGSIRDNLAAWLMKLCGNRKAEIRQWADALYATNDVPSKALAVTLAGLLGNVGGEFSGRMRTGGDLEGLSPGRLLELVDNGVWWSNADRTKLDFTSMLQDLRDDPREVAPELQRRLYANVQTVMQQMQAALQEDLERLFLHPLLVALQNLARTDNRSGLQSASRTSLSVLSGTKATVDGSAQSYFDVSEQPKLDADALDRATTMSAGLAGLGLPAGAFASIALALGSGETKWSVMTEGASVTFTPTVLSGGASAEMEVDCKIAHADPGDKSEDGTGNAVPLSRVAHHTAKTTVYLEPLDLFALSSFSLRTTHPRPDFVVPILGQIPLFGQMFRFSRSPSHVHHESLLVIFSTISPTGTNYAESLAAARPSRR